MTYHGSYFDSYRSQETRYKFGRPKGESFTVEFIERDFPDVYISSNAHSKMWSLVKMCDIEISWLSTVIREDNGDFLITDVIVPEQTCSSATTEIDKSGVNNMIEEMLNEGRGKDLNDMKCWGHSHVDMNVKPSHTDEGQTKEFLDKRKDFFIRLICNKRGDMGCSVYLRDENLILHEPKIIVEDGFENYDDWATEQIELKVEEEFFSYRKPKSGPSNLKTEYLEYISNNPRYEADFLLDDIYGSPYTDYDGHYEPARKYEEEE